MCCTYCKISISPPPPSQGFKFRQPKKANGLQILGAQQNYGGLIKENSVLNKRGPYQNHIGPILAHNEAFYHFLFLFQFSGVIFSQVIFSNFFKTVFTGTEKVVLEHWGLNIHIFSYKTQFYKKILYEAKRIRN